MPGAAKKNGRPFVHTVTEKPCAQCGEVFGMADVGVTFPSHFADVRYCSPECREAARSPSLGDLIARTKRDEDTGCQNWQGRLTAKGYGRLIYCGRSVRAHRLAYELSKGPIPNGLMVLHGCDNRRCINPDHLRTGTAKDNWDDCVSRGRSNPRFNSSKGGPALANNRAGQES